MKTDKIILDACCGGRCFWFNKNHGHTIYIDNEPRAKGICKERPEFNCTPDLVADFTNLPFKDKQFKHIVWDPPHLTKLMETSMMRKKYGVLNNETWQSDLKKGFKELWRVLDNYGTLIFKWNEGSISIDRILKLFPIEPLYGHPTAKHGKTKWFAFVKIPNNINESNKKIIQTKRKGRVIKKIKNLNLNRFWVIWIFEIYAHDFPDLIWNSFRTFEEAEKEILTNPTLTNPKDTYFIYDSITQDLFKLEEDK